MMKSQPNSTLIGGNSGGGSGSPMKYELPNGLSFRLSTTQSVNKDYQFYEKIGIPPEIEVTNSPDDFENHIDRIIERAIKEINNND